MPPSADLLADAAARIGSRLVAEAIWNGDACTWQINTLDLKAESSNTTVNMPAKDDLYHGASGIALFLGELWAYTGDRALLRCARGALRHCESLRAPEAPARIAFHSGDTGIAYVAARIVELTGDEEWLAIADRHLERLETQIASDQAYDVLGGAAGAILGLLAIDRATRRAARLPLAVRMGEHLVLRSVRRKYGWSWRGGPTTRQDLCGYAHGASGIAHAFLELYASTGEARWRFAASQAMAYERRHAVDGSGDWPDYRCNDMAEVLRRGALAELREDLRRGRPGPLGEGGPPMRAWCHGAPGIALTRIRAITLGVDADVCRSELAAALRATANDARVVGMRNSSLCHGLFGNLEPVIEAERQLGIPFELDPHVIAAQAVHDFELAGRRWVAGTVGGHPDPSLMIGDAGVGLFLLRLAYPEVPSILCLSDWKAAPAGASDTELRVAETARLLTHTFRVIQKVAGLNDLREQVARLCATAPTVEAAITAVKELVLAAQAGEAVECLREALGIDCARLEGDLEFDDYVHQFCRELARPQASEIDWSTAQFALAPSARLLRTRWNWKEWDERSSPCPAQDDGTFVVYRAGREVKVLPVSPAMTVVLETLGSPLTLAEAADATLAAVDSEGAVSATIPTFVAEVIRNAVASGIAEAQSEPARS